MNDFFCRRVRHPATVALLLCAAFAALALPTAAHAQFNLDASAIGQFESNSNVFDAQSGSVQPGAVALRRSDTFFAYGADAYASYLWHVQQLYATASAKQYDYQHLTGLNHNEYAAEAGLIWQSGGLLDGKASILRTHAMVPFFDLTGFIPTLSFLDELREDFQINLQVSPVWKLQGAAHTSITDQSNKEGMFTQLHETSGTGSILYSGFGPLTSGFRAGYTSGHYNGDENFFSGFNGSTGSGFIVNNNSSYTQTTAGLVANYKHNRLTFEGEIGYTRRESADDTNSTSGLTGLFDVTYRLTPRTTVKAQIQRTINSYFTDVSSDIETDAGVSVNWQATPKISVNADYNFSYRNYPRQGNNPVGSDRVDIQETATAAVAYQPRTWLQIRTYANVQTRRSTFIGAHFSGDIFGIAFTVTPIGQRVPPPARRRQ